MRPNKRISAKDYADAMEQLKAFTVKEIHAKLEENTGLDVHIASLRAWLLRYSLMIDYDTDEPAIGKTSNGYFIEYYCTKAQAERIRNGELLARNRATRVSRAIKKSKKAITWGDKIIGTPGTKIRIMAQM